MKLKKNGKMMTDKEQRAEYTLITILSCFFLSITGLMQWSGWFGSWMTIQWSLTGFILMLLFFRFMFVWTSMPPRPKF